MSPTVITVMVISAFFLGYISRWLQDTDGAPIDEDHVSQECMDWIERRERSR